MTDTVGERLRRRGTALAVAVLVAGTLGLGFRCGAPPAPAAPTVAIRDAVVTVEIAKSRAEQSLGLGNRTSLEWGHGMLFPYDEPGFLAFWMKRMHFDIDIVWIRDGRIVGISAFVPYPRDDPDHPATVRSPELVDMVLEVPAGFSNASGWRRGDRVELRGVPAAS